MDNFKMPKRNDISNKGDFGKVLNISGSKYMRGAAVLSSKSALKVGCGYVCVASCEDVLNTVSNLLPEAVLASVENAQKNIFDYSAILIGCGLSTDDNAQRIFSRTLTALKEFAKPVIIDADGLNLLAKSPQVLGENYILTPHPKEAARLLNVSIDEILKNPYQSAVNLSNMYYANIVLKMPKTHIYGVLGNLYVYDAPNSALAKAGSGDVLSGIIAGLSAQGMKPYNASVLGVQIHSKSAKYASKIFGKYSLLASELIDYIHLGVRDFT